MLLHFSLLPLLLQPPLRACRANCSELLSQIYSEIYLFVLSVEKGVRDKNSRAGAAEVMAIFVPELASPVDSQIL